MMSQEDKIEVVCQNRKARHEYLILDTVEAGIVLLGHEVKSVREHHVTLDASYATVTDGEVWLVDCNIDAHKFTHHVEHKPKRRRKLLLHKREITKFGEKAAQQGHTLVPLRMYFKNGRAKVELAVCKGKQQHDKRQAMKEKDAKKEIRRQQ